MNSLLVAFLDDHAGWFVIGGWLFFLTTMVAGGIIGLVLVITDAYSDSQIVYPIHKTIVSVIAVAVRASLIAAISASIALTTGYRVLASALLATADLALIGGSVVALILSPRGVQELFDRCVGKQHFLLPRRNKPPN